MGNYKATRIKVDGITLDLDRPIVDPVYYQTIRRLSLDRAVERLVRDQHLKAEKETRRTRAKEDALIKALNAVGSIFVPDVPRKRRG